MYQYYHNRKYDLLIVQHFNDFIGAETTQAMVAITKLLPKKDLISLKYVIADFRKVSSSTLYDTDRALHTLLHSQFGALRSNLKFVRLYEIKIGCMHISISLRQVRKAHCNPRTAPNYQ